MNGFWEVRVGDALDRLAELPDGSVQTCVTSPPYFGLRDYGTGEWKGGDGGCDHRGPPSASATASTLKNDGRPLERMGQNNYERETGAVYRDSCGKCGARRTDSQLGLEPTPDEYVARLVEVFRQVRRVSRDDGTLWLNLGDSYAGAWGRQAESRDKEPGSGRALRASPCIESGAGTIPPGANYKAKDLLGIPWLVAFALRADGWYLRSDIVWAKPNPMPESVTDRPTKAHEYVFLLSKSPRYFYDAEAVREDAQDWSKGGPGTGIEPTHHHGADNGGNEGLSAIAQRYKDGTQQAGRNKRSVWTVATQPFPGAHFAVFPPKLIEPCVLAGSSDRACGVCGAPWERVVETDAPGVRVESVQPKRIVHRDKWIPQSEIPHGRASHTVGWRPSCDHQDGTGTSVVLDPFAGAGTTGLVATRHGRSFIGIELNPEYAEMARTRIRDDAPLMNYLLEREAT